MIAVVAVALALLSIPVTLAVVEARRVVRERRQLAAQEQAAALIRRSTAPNLMSLRMRQVHQNHPTPDWK